MYSSKSIFFVECFMICLCLQLSIIKHFKSKQAMLYRNYGPTTTTMMRPWPRSRCLPKLKLSFFFFIFLTLFFFNICVCVYAHVSRAWLLRRSALRQQHFFFLIAPTMWLEVGAEVGVKVGG